MTKSKCCGADVRTVQSAVSDDSMQLCNKCNMPCKVITESDQPKPEDDWEIARKLAMENNGTQHDFNFTKRMVYIGLAEGRKREREEAIREIINRGAKELTREIEPIVQQREEAAAREAFAFLFAENEANGFTDMRGFTVEKFVDSSMRAMAEWKQRKSQGDIGV